MGTIVFGKGKETTAEVVTIGTSAACDLVINDPVVAATHARIFQRDGLFVLEDAGSSSGTWKNGQVLAQSEALAQGDVLVVGCSRIDVKITPGADGGKLELAVKEKSFFFEPSRGRPATSIENGKAGSKTVVGGDSERWVRDEVLFGHFKGLMPTNLLAVLVGLALLVLVGFASMRGRLLQPDDLHASHANLFASDRVATGANHEKEHWAIADTQGCNACHGTLGGTPIAKCEQCHADVITAKHPFMGDRSQSGTTLAQIALSEDMCSSCHLDHKGREPSGEMLKPSVASLAQKCADCHGAAVPVESGTRRPVDKNSDYSIYYDAFPHKSHGEVQCEVCHAAPAVKKKVAGSKRDYAVVNFETCMGCHAADDASVAGARFKRDPNLEKLTKAKVKPQHLVRLAWHGAGGEKGSHCLDCHAKTFEKDLRETTTRRFDHLSFAVQRRDHQELFASHVKVASQTGKQQECNECHADGKPVQSTETKDARFWHALHLTQVKPGNSAQQISNECLECHTELNASKNLVGRPGPSGDSPGDAIAYHGPDSQSCGKCHKDAKGASLIGKVTEPKDGTVVARVDFPHGVHIDSKDVSLRPACFTCHGFAQSDELFAARPTTTAAASACMPCHADHKSVGGVGHVSPIVERDADIAPDGCVVCHPSQNGKTDLAYFGTLDPVKGSKLGDDLEVRRKKARADTTGFSHFTNGHEGECQSCHGDVKSATTIKDVKIPSESGTTCWDCHVKGKQQFHWRGSKIASTEPAQTK